MLPWHVAAALVIKSACPFPQHIVQVVYVREGVAVWPTKNQRIMGRLSLIKQHQVMFLAWLPYSQGSLNKDGTFQSAATAQKSATQSAKGVLDSKASDQNEVTAEHGDTPTSAMSHPGVLLYS